jgi:hypothetical protein
MPRRSADLITRQKVTLATSPSATGAGPPNRRVQPTPLRVDEIVRILKALFVSKVISIYRCGAADAQAVGPPQAHSF